MHVLNPLLVLNNSKQYAIAYFFLVHLMGCQFQLATQLWLFLHAQIARFFRLSIFFFSFHFLHFSFFFMAVSLVNDLSFKNNSNKTHFNVSFFRILGKKRICKIH